MLDHPIYTNLANLIRAREETPFEHLEADAARSADAGLAVYRNNVRSSLSKALAETFPVVFQLVGEAFFKFAAHEYFHHHPPTSRLVIKYGDRFPAFLESFEPASSTPYLADVARLELIWLQAYHASDVAPLEREQILAQAGDDPSNLYLKLHPSLRLLTSSYPSASIWRQHQKEVEQNTLDMSIGENILIVRPHLTVNVHIVSAGTLAAIKAIAQGASIGDAFATACDQHEHVAPQDVFQTIFTTQIVIAATNEKPGAHIQ